MGNQIHPIAFLTLTSKHKQLLWSPPSPHRKQSTRLSTSHPVQDATFFPWITTERLRHPLHTAAAAKSLQSCPTLCNPIDGSPPSSLVPGILQARTLEWVAISFSNAWKWKVKVKSLSRVQPSTTPWTAAFQASPSMGFSRQEYWSGVPLPSPTPHSSQNEFNKKKSGTSLAV